MKHDSIDKLGVTSKNHKINELQQNIILKKKYAAKITETEPFS